MRHSVCNRLLWSIKILYISFMIYIFGDICTFMNLYLYARRSVCRQGALREHLNTHVYAGGRFQLLLLTTCIHLSLILLLYYYILLLVPLLPLQPLLLFILIEVLTTRFISVESAQNCFMNGMRFLC